MSKHTSITLILKYSSKLINITEIHSATSLLDPVDIFCKIYNYYLNTIGLESSVFNNENPLTT